MVFNPTSQKTTTANTVVNTTAIHVASLDPETPAFLPKKPEDIDPNSGKIIIAKYII